MESKRVFKLTAPRSTEPQIIPLDGDAPFDRISAISGIAECNGVSALLNDREGKVLVGARTCGDVLVKVSDPEFFGAQISLILTFE